MAIKLKTKVALGGIFLFGLLILVAAVSFFYLNRISEESKGIVKDNYETLNYSRDMLNELNDPAGFLLTILKKLFDYRKKISLNLGKKR